MSADGFFIMTIMAWDIYFYNNLTFTAVKFETVFLSNALNSDNSHE